MLTSTGRRIASHASILRVKTVSSVIVKGAVDQSTLWSSAGNIVHEDRASSLAIESIGVGYRNCSKQVQSDQNVTGSEKVIHFYDCWKLVLPGCSKQFTQHHIDVYLRSTFFRVEKYVYIVMHACMKWI